MPNDSDASEFGADGGRRSARDPASSESARKAKEKRFGMWVALAVPVVVFWLLLLFAPASSGLAFGERVAGGTTIAAIIAGIPQVVVPRGFDQPDTAARVEALGIGLSVPWNKRHRRLTPALHRVLSEPRYSKRAAALGACVRQEDGAATSANAIESHLP